MITTMVTSLGSTFKDYGEISNSLYVLSILDIIIIYGGFSYTFIATLSYIISVSSIASLSRYLESADWWQGLVDPELILEWITLETQTAISNLKLN